MNQTMKPFSADVSMSKSVLGNVLIDALYIKNYDAEVILIDGLWYVCMGYDGSEPLWEPASNQDVIANFISTSQAGAAFIHQNSESNDEYLIH